MPEWEIFIREIRKEMTVKAGQKCTAIRRIFVPENKLEQVSKSLAKALSQTSIGNPQNEKVRMGPLAGETQRKEVRERIQKLLASSQIIYGSLDSVELVDADLISGAFMSPLLLENLSPFSDNEPHDIEAFGPVAVANSVAYLSEVLEPISIVMGLTRRAMMQQSFQYILLGEGETGLLVYSILVRYWEAMNRASDLPVIVLISESAYHTPQIITPGIVKEAKVKV